MTGDAGVQALGLLKRLHAELLKDAPGWGTADYMARLIASFFMETERPEGPRFGEAARSLLEDLARLDWQAIHLDVFGSMLQTLTDDEERGELGMHYTSVSNVLKLLDPLLLDDLRAALDRASDDPRALGDLRDRLSRIRLFDPACGSGNVLVVAYQQLRGLEVDIDRRLGEPARPTGIPLTNFRGIELRELPAELARLALVIARRRDGGDGGNTRIIQGNALQLDWAEICPPGEGETYVCGNPPYLGSKWQSEAQKADLAAVFAGRVANWKSLDYAAGWFMKAADYTAAGGVAAAFVTTNSICQGLQVPILWPALFATGNQVLFAHTSFKWANPADGNAAVTVAIVGLGTRPGTTRRLFSIGEDGAVVERRVDHLNAYLVPVRSGVVKPARRPLFGLSPMLFGNMPRDGGAFVLDAEARSRALRAFPELERFIRPYLGSEQLIQGTPRWCLWIEDADAGYAAEHPYLGAVLEKVRAFRQASLAGSTREFANQPHRFVQIAGTAKEHALVVAKVSSERRAYLPVDRVEGGAIASDLLFALYDAPLWNLALLGSRLHRVWVAAVCGKLKTDFRYSNTLGWNTFPVPELTEDARQALTRCAEGILIARKRHHPKTIADLYAPKAMPSDLREAHDLNDDTLERLYLGRPFRDDAERLETLFELYAKREARPPGFRDAGLVTAYSSSDQR